MAESKAAASGPKVLRVGIVQGGKIIEEREVKRREPVSIGTGKNTFSINSDSLPKSFDLFDHDGKSYFLRFDAGIEGRLQLDDEPVADFPALEARGQVVQRSGKKAVRLTERSRGKVMIGDVTVLFQFKPVTPAPVRPVLPPDVRGSILQTIDAQFAAIFVVVAILQISVLTYARSLPYVEPTSLEELSESFQRLVMPDRIPEPPRSPAARVDAQKQAKKEPETPKEEKKPPKEEKTAEKKPAPPSEGQQKDPGQAREAARQRARQAGLVGAIGRIGSDGALADVFSEGGGSGQSLGEAFSGAQGVELAAGPGGGTRGGGSGEAVGVGKLGTQGGRSVSTVGQKQEAAVSGKLAAESAAVDGDLDPAKIQAELRRRQSALKACYETALKRDRSLKGKIILSFEIDVNGRLRDLKFGGSLRSAELESCIRARASAWRFPKPDGGSVFVDYPVVLTPSS